MDNVTWGGATLLRLEGLNLAPGATAPVFLLFLAAYVFIMLANAGAVLLILTHKNLRQPMYLLFCNLSLNDVVGNSIMLPGLLRHMLLPPPQRLISYSECAVQAFTTHMFGTTSHTVLMIMAFDRYVAICDPLRYAAIMTNRMVLKLTAWAWGVALVLVGVLLGLTLRLDLCRTLISNPYCDNPSLFKLSCDSVLVNNVYGLTFTVVLFSASIGSMIVTYGRITVVCVSGRNRALSSKAIKTCTTHLLLYLIMLFSGSVVILLHRFPQYSDQRKLSAILFHVVPGSLNPVIYGVQSAEICRSIARLFGSKTNL